MSRRVDARGVARRYARALLDVAVREGQAERVRDDLRGVVATLDSHPQLREVLAHPALGAEVQVRLVGELFASRELAPVTVRLLGLLAQRHRVLLAGVIAEEYGLAWNEHRGVVSARAVSAAALDAGQREALRGALERITAREVELDVERDPGLLGGLKVHLEGRVYDGTVRARLRALRSALVGAAG